MKSEPDVQVLQAATLDQLCVLAMASGPWAHLNAVGVGAAGDPLVTGDAAMIGLVAVRRAGTGGKVRDAVPMTFDPVKISFSGLILSVDSGGSAGNDWNF